MRFLTHRTRWSYWSLSKLAHYLRKKAGLTSPSALTLEGWDAYEVDCHSKAPIIHWVTKVGFNKAQNIWMFIPDVIYTIRVATIWKFFNNICVFRKALWNFRTWDYSGLLQFMEISTREMHNTHKNHGHLLRSGATAKELLIVSTLLKRIREDRYMDQVQGFRLPNKGIFGGEFYQVPNTLPSIKSKRFYKMREQAKKDDLMLACKIIERKLLTFWD